MKVQTKTLTQIQKIVTLTPEEIQAIVVDHLQSVGVIDEDCEVTIENVLEAVSVKLLSKMQVSVTPELEVLQTTTETQELIKVAQPKDDTTLTDVDHTVATINSSKTLSKLVGPVEDINRNSVFADPIEDLPTPIVTQDLFSDPDEHSNQETAITNDFLGDGEDQIVAKKPATENLFA